MDLEALTLPVKILKTFGVWIKKDSSIIYKIYCAIMQTLFVYGFTFMIACYIVNVSDIIDFADQSSLFCTYVVCSVKCINLIFQTDALENVIAEIKQSLNDYEINKSYKKHVNKAYMLLKIYWGATFSNVFMAGFFPFFSDRLAYRMWFPYSLDIPVLYYMSALYQWFGTLCYSACNVMLDMIPVILISFYIAQLEHLSDRLSLIKPQNDPEMVNNNKKELITCINYQVKIIELVRKTERIFAGVIVTQGLFSSAIMCTTTYALTILTDSAMMFRFGTYMLAMIIQIFIPCYYGTKLRIAYDRIIDSLFHSEWVNEDREFKMNMKFFMQHSKNPLRIVAFGFVKIDLQNFMTICNSAYSLFNVFKKTKK